MGGGATSSVGGRRESGESVVSHPFFLPFIRLELLIRSIRTTRWDLETWPTVKVELRRALSLRRGLARDGWWN